MSSSSFKKLRPLLWLFLLIYAACTLIPAGVSALGHLGDSTEPVSANLTPSSSPSPSLSPSTSSTPTPTPTPAPDSSPEATDQALPGFLDARELPSSNQEEDVFTLYDSATGETFQVSAEEFLPAALACEMDLSAPDEALKAQAVALYTFYCNQRARNDGDGADFACDTANWLVYVPQTAMEERWGENFASYYEKLQSITAEVRGQRASPFKPAFSPFPVETPLPHWKCGARTWPICLRWQAPATACPTAICPPSPSPPNNYRTPLRPPGGTNWISPVLRRNG